MRLGSQEADLHELVHQVGGRLGLEPGNCGGVSEVGLRAEHPYGGEQRRRTLVHVRGQGARPLGHRRRHELVDPVRRPDGVLRVQQGAQLVDEEGVAGCRLVEGAADLV